MAKKKTAPKEPSTPAKNKDDNAENERKEEDDEDYEESNVELLQVDLGDMVKMKQVLDEAVFEYIQEELLDEDPRMDNIKLAVMTLACVFALVAQFAPVPFPESRPFLGVCCVSYFLLSGVLQLITTFVDKDTIMLTKPKGADKTKNKDLQSHGVRVRSQFPRFSEYYTLILEFQGREDSPLVEQKWSVGQFFDKEGYFDVVGLQMEVKELFQRLEDGKYDRNSLASKKND